MPGACAGGTRFSPAIDSACLRSVHWSMSGRRTSAIEVELAGARRQASEWVPRPGTACQHRAMPADQEAREVRVRKELRTNGFRLLRREDGFYNVTERGVIMAPNGWRVRERELNDRGGSVGDAYPLTLGWIEHWIRGSLGKTLL